MGVPSLKQSQVETTTPSAAGEYYPEIEPGSPPTPERASRSESHDVGPDGDGDQVADLGLPPRPRRAEGDQARQPRRLAPSQAHQQDPG
jgi:hypothetical protein